MKTLLYIALTPAATTPSNLDALGRLSAAFVVAPTVIVSRQTESIIGALGMSAQSIDDYLGEPISSRLLAQPPIVAQAIARAVAARRDVVAIVAPHTPSHLDFLSLLSAALEIPFITNINAIAPDAIEHLICASRVVERIPLPSSTFCATFQSSIEAPQSPCAEIAARAFAEPSIDRSALRSFMPFDSGDFDLDTAQIVFAAGRGIGNAENFARLTDCARKFGAAIAASRCAVDLGWARSDLQVGQTGKTIAPDIYVAFGISGAIQHLAGIRQAKTLIAINTDADAPIFESADYGLREDANRILQFLMGYLTPGLSATPAP